MKAKYYIEISIRILILGSLGFFMTFVSESLTEFFGDTLHSVCDYKRCRCGAMDNNVLNKYIWGSRHYWYFYTLTALFLWSLASLFMRLTKLINNDSLT